MEKLNAFLIEGARDNCSLPDYENEARLPNEEENPVGVTRLTQFEPALLERALNFKRFLIRQMVH